MSCQRCKKLITYGGVHASNNATPGNATPTCWAPGCTHPGGQCLGTASCGGAAAASAGAAGRRRTDHLRSRHSRGHAVTERWSRPGRAPGLAESEEPAGACGAKQCNTSTGCATPAPLTRFAVAAVPAAAAARHARRRRRPGTQAAAVPATQRAAAAIGFPTSLRGCDWRALTIKGALIVAAAAAAAAAAACPPLCRSRCCCRLPFGRRCWLAVPPPLAAAVIDIAGCQERAQLGSNCWQLRVCIAEALHVAGAGAQGAAPQRLRRHQQIVFGWLGAVEAGGPGAGAALRSLHRQHEGQAGRQAQ